MAPSGGKRIGAGRPAKAPETRKSTLSVRLAPNDREKLERLAKAQGIKITTVVEKLIQSAPDIDQ